MASYMLLVCIFIFCLNGIFRKSWVFLDFRGFIMDKLIIIGGVSFNGEICIFGLKNLVLLVLVVILLCDEKMRVCNLLYF